MDWSHFLVDEKKRVYCISLLLLLRVQIPFFAVVCVLRSLAVVANARDDEEEEEEKWPSDVFFFFFFLVGREIEKQIHRKAEEIE